MAGDIELDKDDPSSLAGRIWVGATVALIAFLAYSPQIWIIWPSYASYEKIDALSKRLAAQSGARCGGSSRSQATEWLTTLLSILQPVQAPQKSSLSPVQAMRPQNGSSCQSALTRVDWADLRGQCPWINNCVGHHNTADFVRFLFWVDISCTYHLIMVSRRAFGNLVYYENATSVTALVMLVMNYVLCIPVLLAVGGFSFYHFWCLSSNTTTIEGWEKDKVAVLRRRGRIREVKYPYDLGFMKNISSVMGYHPLLWCWPQRSYGDGLSYRAAEAVKPFAQYFWPPRDQYAPHYQRRTPFPDASVATFEPGSLLAQSDEENSEEDVLTEEEDDIPLAQLKGSLAPDIGPASQRLRKRRGSEGYEIKPMQRTAHTHDEPDYDTFMLIPYASTLFWMNKIAAYLQGRVYAQRLKGASAMTLDHGDQSAALASCPICTKASLRVQCRDVGEPNRFRYYQDNKITAQTTIVRNSVWSLTQINRPRGSELTLEASPNRRIITSDNYELPATVSLEANMWDTEAREVIWSEPYRSCCRLSIKSDYTFGLISTEVDVGESVATRTCRASTGYDANFPACPETYTAPTPLVETCTVQLGVPVYGSHLVGGGHTL
ncbi:hypothetical protein E5Q_03260 [Mixia osmundae IAM 14324]|uniref:Palmitoyltransferase n=1 Tax=Mixia osmundae (strain CBS 9802 / IAM 14324 / JCM 22182 / KY 12970) TaxID=764103 RepID=G7E180_MIXOS|nr:hypothetical protein E5Q_03260 [Mixia osmundae IAM 14324]